MKHFLPLVLLLSAPHIRAQPASPTISVSVNLVVLHAAVRDRAGAFVSGLGRNNFHVFENGRPQEIRLFQHEDVPVAVGLVVDNSGSMGPKRKEVTAAAVAFVRNSNPQDRMFVVNFNERVTLGLSGTELRAASSHELEVALNRFPPNGRTALYDAIEAGLAILQKATLDNKALIVVSDGGDNASRHTLKQVLASAARSDAVIYTIGLFDEDDPDSNPRALKKIAHATGGEAFFPEDPSEVVPICKQIAEDIRQRYTIGYVPSNPALDNTWRSIRLEATGRNGRACKVLTRAGYIADPGKAHP